MVTRAESQASGLCLLKCSLMRGTSLLKVSKLIIVGKYALLGKERKENCIARGQYRSLPTSFLLERISSIQ